MGDLQENLLMALRYWINRFFEKKESQPKHPLASSIREIQFDNYQMWMFGGMVRDILAGKVPRDADLVIEGGSVNQIEQTHRDKILRKTRFGGLNLQVNGWKLDVWPVRETWAFKEGIVKGGEVAHLPHTTFFNIEAIVVEVDANRRARLIFENEFLKGMYGRTLEINLEENPYPALCLVRALSMASKYDLRFSPKLVRYIDHYFRYFEDEELVKIQLTHYSTVLFGVRELRLWRSCIQHHIRWFPLLYMHSPFSGPQRWLIKSERINGDLFARSSRFCFLQEGVDKQQIPSAPAICSNFPNQTAPLENKNPTQNSAVKRTLNSPLFPNDGENKHLAS